MAAPDLTAHHGKVVGTSEEREYLMVCGFTGDSACYQISPLNGHLVWTPVMAEEEDLDMSMLEYVHSYTNMIKDGVTSMWMNKSTGEYQFLWSPMNRKSPDVGFDQMAGWYKDSVPTLTTDFPSLGSYAHLSCLAQHPLSDGYPSMVTLSGGYNGSDSLSNLLVMSNVGEGDWQWHTNSLDIGQPRSEHSCISFDLLGESGVLLAGGFSINGGGIVPSSLSSLVFMFAENGNHDDLSNMFTGMAEMVKARAGFGLANWGEEGLVALGGKNYGIFPGVTGSYRLMDTVEIWDKNEDSWSVREEWRMGAPRAAFGIVAKGDTSEVHGSEYCNM